MTEWPFASRYVGIATVLVLCLVVVGWSSAYTSESPGDDAPRPAETDRRDPAPEPEPDEPQTVEGPRAEDPPPPLVDERRSAVETEATSDATPEPGKTARLVRKLGEPSERGEGPFGEQTVWPLSGEGLRDALAELDDLYGDDCENFPSERVDLRLDLEVHNEDGLGVVRVVDIQESSTGEMPEYADCVIGRVERILVDPPPEGAMAQTTVSVRFFP